MFLILTTDSAAGEQIAFEGRHHATGNNSDVGIRRGEERRNVIRCNVKAKLWGEVV